ncbi:MAG: ATP-binding protein [Anaerolineae bacterium]|nr:ATP-binding protein [Anaerolineae bacterium]
MGKTIVDSLKSLVAIPTTDPDDARRRRLLNILLIGALITGTLALAATLALDLGGAEWAGHDRLTAYLGSCVVIIVSLSLLLVGRYVAGWLAAALFLVFLVAAAAFTDVPEEVADGRGLLVFAIPIMMGSIILPPPTSFAMAALCSVTIAGIKLSLGEGLPNPFAMLVFFLLATVSWLAARTLEGALNELRAINRELDKRVEERTRDLAEALSRNQAILEGIADGVIVFDTLGRATMANPAMARLIDWPLETIVGSDLDALLGENMDPDDRGVILSLLDGANINAPALKFRWGKRVLFTSFAPVRDNQGRKVGTVAVFRDFTREAELDRMKGAFVSRVSHELRTPLNAILGYADLLKEQVYGPLSEKQSRALERMTLNGRHLLSIVNDLLDQAQIEAGLIKLRVSSFTPQELLGEVISIAEVLAQEKGVELSGYIEANVPSVLAGDRQRLHQILLNLVGNAIKFTDRGWVRVRIYRPDKSHWAMEVADTGCGIPREAQPHIFEPFHQADDSMTRRHHGSGLGLSIVKQLTHLMGGEVTFSSAVGQGSRFTVTLPLVPVQ